MEIKIPEIGESIFEAVIAKWHKEDGAAVRRDEVICELETDKISLELNAETDGILHLAAKEGDTVPIGTVIATLEETDAPAEAATEKKPEPEATKKPAAAPAKKNDKKKTEPAKDPTPAPPVAATAPPAATAPAPAAAPSAPLRDYGPVERKPMTPIRKKIAAHLLAARQQTAMLTTFNEADMSRVIALRQKHQEHFVKKHKIKLGFMSFFIKAVVEGLKEYPLVNASIDGNDIVHHNYYHVGVAIGTERGLVVPVIRNTDKLHFAEIEQTIADFAEKANNGKLDMSDLEGGTFTISNGGVYGSVLSTPILNPPQSAVLGMHAVQKRAVVVDDQIVIRPMMSLALSYDHRIIDGREAVSFLKLIKDYIEDPEEMLLEM